jgi:predicted nucleotidyltransferase
MSIQLKDSEIQFIKKTLGECLPEAKFYIFGSRAIGVAKKYSDLDLLISSKNILPLSLLSQLKETFIESNLPFKVDIVDEHRITKTFLDKIKTQWVSL